MKCVNLEKLRKCRESKKISYQFMSDKLEVTKSYYWQIEHGKRRLSYDNAIKIADIFKTTPDKLFYDDFKSKQL